MQLSTMSKASSSPLVGTLSKSPSIKSAAKVSGSTSPAAAAVVKSGKRLGQVASARKVVSNKRSNAASTASSAASKLVPQVSIPSIGLKSSTKASNSRSPSPQLPISARVIRQQQPSPSSIVPASAALAKSDFSQTSAGTRRRSASVGTRSPFLNGTAATSTIRPNRVPVVRATSPSAHPTPPRPLRPRTLTRPSSSLSLSTSSAAATATTHR
jgi:hypothetical protein